jgi:glycosyltransferase involved in cell wall biosynthesis
VRAVHAYEDCSLAQFEAAHRLGKACLYDLPIGFYPAWQATETALLARFADWIPTGGLPSSRYARVEQKLKEMQLADVVLVPSEFVEQTVLAHHPAKAVVRAPYGVDAAFWSPASGARPAGPLRFLFAGQLSVRKGVPLLLEAWRAAALDDAELELVGSWQLSESARAALPANVRCSPPCPRAALRERFRGADVFVLPSYFEGLALVTLEAMACGLPVIATPASGASHLVGEANGRLVPTGNVEALVESLRWMASHRERLGDMGRAARATAERASWDEYRKCVNRCAERFA